MGMNPDGWDVLIGGWVFIGLALPLILARVYLRLIIQKRKLLLSDAFMIGAWISGASCMIIPVNLLKLGALDKGVNTALQHYKGRLEDIPLIFKLIWASNVPYWTTIYLCKAALLAMYLEIFPDFMRKRRMFLWATIVYNCLSFIASILVLFFMCLPIEENWDLNPESTCPPSLGLLTVKIGWALSILGDILVFILPFTVIYGLNMKRSLKIGVYFTFLLGIVNIVIDTLRFGTIMVVQVGGNTVPTATIALWGTLDSSIAVVIACLPSLRPYFSPPEGKHADLPPPLPKSSHTASTSTPRTSGVGFNNNKDFCGETLNSAGSRDSYNMHDLRQPSNPAYDA